MYFLLLLSLAQDSLHDVAHGLSWLSKIEQIDSCRQVDRRCVLCCLHTKGSHNIGADMIASSMKWEWQPQQTQT